MCEQFLETIFEIPQRIARLPFGFASVSEKQKTKIINTIERISKRTNSGIDSQKAFVDIQNVILKRNLDPNNESIFKMLIVSRIIAEVNISEEFITKLYNNVDPPFNLSEAYYLQMFINMWNEENIYVKCYRWQYRILPNRKLSDMIPLDNSEHIENIRKRKRDEATIIEEAAKHFRQSQFSSNETNPFVRKSTSAIQIVPRTFLKMASNSSLKK